jgi:hypothetical protein
MTQHILRMEMEEIACPVFHYDITGLEVTTFLPILYIWDSSILDQTTFILIVYYYKWEEQLKISCLHS